VTVLKALFLGIIQGLTEFLPVSSSGHLMVAQKWFGLPDAEEMLLFDIILHLATLFAVVLVFRKKIWELLRHPLCKTNYCLVLATVISCALVLILNPFLGEIGYSVLPWLFLVTAAILLAAHFLTKYVPAFPGSEPRYWQAALMGAVQGLAVLPGISRSGSTLAAGLASRMKREAAAEFSFLLSIPIIIASFVFSLISGGGDAISFNWVHVLVGGAGAFVCGLIAIKFMLAAIKHVQLYWFSIYLVILAILVFAI
jgi:undecaprenyl-diphosphatase